MATRKGGNVLDALMGANLGLVDTGSLMFWIEVDRVVDNPYRDRLNDDYVHIGKLATSIAGLKGKLPATLGLQQVPVGRLVRKFGDEWEPFDEFVYKQQRTIRELLVQDDVYVQLMFGHSRLRAFRVLAHGLISELNKDTNPDFVPLTLDADYTRFPVFLAPATKEDMWRHTVVENAQRADITAIEQAKALRRAINELGMKTEEAAQTFGWQRSTAANKLRLLDLPAEVQQALETGKISERHARELCRLSDNPVDAVRLTKDAIAKGWSIAELKSKTDYALEEIEKLAKQAAEIAEARRVLEAGWTPPGSDKPLPVERLRLDVQSWEVRRLYTDDATLKTGMCSPDCPCMCAAYDRWVSNAETKITEHVVLCCSDYSEHRAKNEAAIKVLAAQPEARAEAKAEAKAMKAEAERIRMEREQKQQEREDECRRIWEEGIAKLSVTELWSSLAFWQTVMNSWDYRVKEILQKATSERDACWSILELLFLRSRSYQQDVERTMVDPVMVRKTLHALKPPKRAKKEVSVVNEEVTLPQL